MSTPVGIVIRTKDRPGFLARALDDIAAQTSRDWSIVVVNDGGDPEAVAHVVNEHPSRDRIAVIDIAPGKGGRCVAANTGVRAVDAPYVVLHDDDDLWDPEFLAETTAWLDGHESAAGVMVPTEIRYEERQGDRWVETSRAPFWEGMERISLGDLLTINRAVPISFLYRRSLHDEVGGYDETLDAVEDWDFYLRVAPVHEIGFLPGRPLAYWSQRPHAVGADGNSMFELDDAHARDDAIVRDRALAEWIRRQGPGVPLHLAAIEKRLSEQIDLRFDALEARLDARLNALRGEMAQEIHAHQPVWSRLRRLRRRLVRRGR